jgi:hypothetical protein
MGIKTIKLLLLIIIISSIALAGTYAVFAWTPAPVADDPLVRMPGTQPGQTTLEAANRCLNCHEGYDSAVEPGFNWMGSMMAQAARDFLFWSCFTVAAQDTIWAAGSPNATDICERCHFPKGWLEGRSDPTNASLMTGADYDGVQCDFCHTMYDPFFETTYDGTREGADWLNYWDETNISGSPSGPAAAATYAEDLLQSADIQLFAGGSFFTNNLPPVNYIENGSGQFFVSSNSQKRASFADAEARHQTLYSRYHKSKYFCATCHDVSNPVLANLGLSGLADDGTKLITEQYSASSYFHVERTFSEFMLSAYGQDGGAGTNPEFQAQGAPDILNAAKCQDCHMRDVVGVAANKRGIPLRPDESIEHPQSGQPLHDLTGGNAWVSWVLASAVPGSANYDPFNDQQLNQGPSALTLDLTQGVGFNPDALLAGVDRAKQQLLLAATIKNPNYNTATGELIFQVQNNTAHKLISGFPEGRRMFVNIKAFSGGNLIYEANPYDAAAGTLKGLSYPYQPGNGLPDPLPLDGNEAHIDDLVYEMKPTVDLTPAGIDYVEDKSFHFVLATDRYKDNRIPPKGFNYIDADARLSLPVLHGVKEDPAVPWIYSVDEYNGGFDNVSLVIPAGADYVEISLYYQTTSREYIEFLRDEIKGSGNLTLSSPAPSGESNAYIIQSDPFFSQLKAWGNTIWNLWTHNMGVDGAAPFLMNSVTIGVPPTACEAPIPTFLSANEGHTLVDLTWSDESTDPLVAGYKIYYDQAGKAQLVSDAGLVTPFQDHDLTNGVEYCYKVTSYYDAACESGFSNILCATPNNQGQTGQLVGVSLMETGIYTGKGKNQQFQSQTAFTAGDTVVVRAHVLGEDGLPVSNATIEITIGGPETVTLNSNPSDTDGWAEATWQTQKSNKKGVGGTTPGEYSASTTGVTASGYNWDSVTTNATFSVQ